MSPNLGVLSTLIGAHSWLVLCAARVLPVSLLNFPATNISETPRLPDMLDVATNAQPSRSQSGEGAEVVCDRFRVIDVVAHATEESVVLVCDLLRENVVGFQLFALELRVGFSGFRGTA